MPEPSAEYPYVQHMNVRFGPLEIVEVQQLADACTDAWYNQTLCEVNDSVLRLGVMDARDVYDLAKPPKPSDSCRDCSAVQGLTSLLR